MADLRCALVDTLHCVSVCSLLYPPWNCCFDDETEPRPSPHLPPLPPLLFRNLFLAFLHLICLAFFIVSSTSLACLQTPICSTYFWRPFVYFFALTLQYFLFTFFTAPQFDWVFYLSLALGRNFPQPKCVTRIKDYSLCPVIIYSYSWKSKLHANLYTSPKQWCTKGKKMVMGFHKGECSYYVNC